MVDIGLGVQRKISVNRLSRYAFDLVVLMAPLFNTMAYKNIE